MLNTIKGIINSKKDFLEAAEMIFEDALDADFDDVIILGGDTTFTENDDLDESDVTSDDELETSDDDEKKDDEKSDDGETDISDEHINDEEPKSDEGNVMDAPIDDDDSNPIPQGDETPMPLPGDDSLPEPVSNVTGEPVADDNLLSMELDLGTNTPTDILPVPPANAGEAIADDTMTQHVDSGFGGDSVESEPTTSVSDEPIVDTEPTNDLGEEPITDSTTDPLESTVESSIMDEVIDDEFTEAISLSGNEETSTKEEPAPATTEPEGDVVPDDPTPEDNTVTAAVKDKVAEAENPTPEVATDPNEAQEELMKKLSKLTKDMEDAKALVMKSIK